MFLLQVGRFAVFRGLVKPRDHYAARSGSIPGGTGPAITVSAETAGFRWRVDRFGIAVASMRILLQLGDKHRRQLECRDFLPQATSLLSLDWLLPIFAGGGLRYMASNRSRDR